MKRLTFNQLDKVITECFIEIFATAITYDGTHGDFLKLFENATIDENGKKHIPYMQYYLPQDMFEQIYEKYKEKYNLNAWYYNSLRTTVNLGASPTSCYEAWMRNKPNTEESK